MTTRSTFGYAIPGIVSFISAIVSAGYIYASLTTSDLNNMTPAIVASVIGIIAGLIAIHTQTSLGSVFGGIGLAACGIEIAVIVCFFYLLVVFSIAIFCAMLSH